METNAKSDTDFRMVLDKAEKIARASIVQTAGLTDGSGNAFKVDSLCRAFELLDRIHAERVRSTR